MSDKLYGIRAVKEQGHSFGGFYAFSYEPEKLRAMVQFVNTWIVGSSDITNNKKEICHTEKDKYPYYSIVEVPFIV